MPHEEIAWWNFNIPHNERTATCPDFLLHAGEKDRGIIGSWNSDYERLSWAQVKNLIEINRIDLFHRVPSDLRRYRHYIYRLEQEHGSVMKFILQQRLRWSDLTPRGPPFSTPEDMKVLYNDWPYGIDTRIIHLVVWTKFQLEDDPDTGHLTPSAHQQIDEYVKKTFYPKVNPRNIAWFKNWKSLKSVHAVEHFHVMLFDPDMAFIQEITGGDVPLGSMAQGAGTSSVVPV